MGFRSGAFCSVWEINSLSNTQTKARVSISYKNKKTDAYEQDFGGFIVFVGTACAKKALSLKKGDRIKLGDVDVSNRYDQKSGREYTNFKVFSFDTMDESNRVGSSAQRTSDRTQNTGRSEHDYHGDEDFSDDLPFD